MQHWRWFIHNFHELSLIPVYCSSVAASSCRALPHILARPSFHEPHRAFLGHDWHPFGLPRSSSSLETVVSSDSNENSASPLAERIRYATQYIGFNPICKRFVEFRLFFSERSNYFLALPGSRILPSSTIAPKLRKGLKAAVLARSSHGQW